MTRPTPEQQKQVRKRWSHLFVLHCAGMLSEEQWYVMTRLDRMLRPEQYSPEQYKPTEVEV